MTSRIQFAVRSFPKAARIARTLNTGRWLLTVWMLLGLGTTAGATEVIDMRDGARITFVGPKVVRGGYDTYLFFGRRRAEIDSLYDIASPGVPDIVSYGAGFDAASPVGPCDNVSLPLRFREIAVEPGTGLVPLEVRVNGRALNTWLPQLAFVVHIETGDGSSYVVPGPDPWVPYASSFDFDVTHTYMEEGMYWLRAFIRAGCVRNPAGGLDCCESSALLWRITVLSTTPIEASTWGRIKALYR